MSDVRTFPVSAASAIARIEVGTTRSWLQKGWINPVEDMGDRAAAVPGATTLLARNRIVQLAVAARLTQMGMRPQLACKAAYEFSDMSDPLEAPGFDREPGEVFGGGAMTALVAYEDGSAAVVRVGKDTPMHQVFFPIGNVSMMAGNHDDAIVLRLDRLVARVDDAIKSMEG